MYIVGIAIIPVILLCNYINNKDIDKEPKKLLKKVFIWGMVTVLPILVLELNIDKILSTDDNESLIQLFAATFVGVALIEELFKWLVVYFSIYKHKEFNHAYDAIVYCVYSSLGFAVIENLFYVLGGGFSVGLLRAFITVPAHACDAVFMGYYLGKAKQAEFNNNQKKSDKNLVLSLLVPTLTHALYDFFIFSDRTLLLIVFVIFTIAMFIVCFKLVKKVSLVERNFDSTPMLSRPNDELLNRIPKANPNISFWYTIAVISIVSGLIFFFGLTIA